MSFIVYIRAERLARHEHRVIKARLIRGNRATELLLFAGLQWRRIFVAFFAAQTERIVRQIVPLVLLS